MRIVGDPFAVMQTVRRIISHFWNQDTNHFFIALSSIPSVPYMVKIADPNINRLKQTCGSKVTITLKLCSKIDLADALFATIRPIIRMKLTRLASLTLATELRFGDDI